MGEDKEPLVLFSKDYLKSHPDINYFIYGHRHIMLDLMLSRTSRMMILGDWITEFSYAVFDGENMFLEQYIEGETSVWYCVKRIRNNSGAEEERTFSSAPEFL